MYVQKKSKKNLHRAYQIGSDAHLLALHGEGRPGRGPRQETSGQLGKYLHSSWHDGLLAKFLRDVKKGEYKSAVGLHHILKAFIPKIFKNFKNRL